MKKILTLSLTLMLAAALVACGTSTTTSTAPSSSEATTSSEVAAPDASQPEKTTVVITALNADKEEVEIEVPYNPERIAVMDLAVLDMVDNFGFGDRVVGVPKSTSIDYLDSYVQNEAILNLGTLKEPSLEALVESDPQIIFIGGRLLSFYEEFAKIAPVVYLSVDTEIGVVESVKKNSSAVASIFGVEDMVAEKMAGFGTRIDTLADFSKDKTAFVGILSAGGFSALGNNSRCSLIGVEAGFTNVSLADETKTTSTHGNDASFEYILNINPDYIFVLNRDQAIGSESANTAQEVIENELVKKTTAYENGNIVYLENANVWYTAEGGITALDYMLKDLETALLK